MSTDLRPPIQPGEPAPALELPAVNRDGTVSLEDFRGKSAVLVGLYRGLHCPFCRRQIVQLGATQDKLKSLGVETMAVVNTPHERARLYFKYRPARVLLAADPEASTHRAFRVPAIEVVDDPAAASNWPPRATMQQVAEVRVNPTGELPGPTPIFEAAETLNAKDGFEVTDVDKQVAAAYGLQGVGHFLIDRQGIVRWTHVEGGDGLGSLGKLPSESEIMEAARSLAR